jgi:hypothetical protein
MFESGDRVVESASTKVLERPMEAVEPESHDEVVFFRDSP